MLHRSLRCSSRNPVHLFNGLARPPLFPRPSFSEICPFLVLPWRGILSPRATSFPFLSFSRITTKKGQLLISLALGVERVLDVDLARSFLIMPTRVFWHFFVFSVLIFSLRESRPSPNSFSTFSDGVSSKEIYNSAPGRIAPLSAQKPVPRVNKRVFV